jgi:hypothetical protein
MLKIKKSTSEESKVVPVRAKISKEADDVIERICESYNIKRGRLTGLCIYFGINSFIEIEKEAAEDIMGIFEGPEKDTKKIRHYIKSQISKYKQSGRMNLTTMKQIMNRSGKDELFLCLLSEAFNNNKEDEIDYKEVSYGRGE